MSFFKEGKYNLARAYFTKAKSVKSMISEAATKYHSLLSDWMNKQQMLDKGLFIMDSVGVKALYLILCFTKEVMPIFS